MDQQTCHAPAETPREKARHLILKSLGVKRVAAWCGVTEDAVYQWLSRGTDEAPIPVVRVGAIMAAATSEGLDAPLAVLAPAMAQAIGRAAE